jgi:ribonucleoside-triphosphate reductase
MTEETKDKVVEGGNEPRFCRDCGKALKTKGEENKDLEIVGGKLLKYKVHDNGNSDDYIYIFKCDECFAKDPSLRDYQKCEVYSRVVGYIRPVQQWHKGKQQEWSERKDFNLPTE